MTETTKRPGDLHAYFSYRDAPAALRWLERAFGFATTLEFSRRRRRDHARRTAA